MNRKSVQTAEDDMKIVGYQYQWTNPAENPDPQKLPIEWETVITARGQTEQSKVEELLAYRYTGKPVYRVRALYAAKETV